MNVRGRRRCGECGHRWSYFETGSVTCPACGSPRSTSIGDEPTLHTDSPVELDLSGARSRLDDRPLTDVAEAARSAAREYLRARGYVAEGELLDLDGTIHAAAELGYASQSVQRTIRIDEPIERYYLELLSGAEEGRRPDAIPADIRWVRGLAAVDVVRDYRRALTEWTKETKQIESSSSPRAVRSVLDHLRSHEARMAALDGDVPPADAETLVSAAATLGRSIRDGDWTALESVEERLSSLD